MSTGTTPQAPLSTLWRVWTDLGYAVHAEVYEHYMKVAVYEHYMKVAVYECVLFHEAGAPVWDGVSAVPPGQPPPGYALERADASCHPDPVYTTEEAQVYLSGSIKWDSCSNLRFDEQDNVMLHFCGKEQAMNVGVLLGRLYDLAAEQIPAWNG